MIQLRVPQNVVDRPRHAAALVVGPEDDPAELGQDDGPDALGARFQGDVQRGVGQPVRPDPLQYPMFMLGS